MSETPNYSALLPILDRGPGFIRFAVDAVEPAAAALPELATSPMLEQRRESTPLVVRSEGPFVHAPCDHPLGGAVALAFTGHRPLILTPDAVWLTLARGVSQHVERDPDGLRAALVRPAEEKNLGIQWNGQDIDDAAGWSDAVEQFCDKVQAQVLAPWQDFFLCDFSQSTPEARVASGIALMSAFKHFFNFIIVGVCGIPEIELRGSVEDWRRVRERISRLHRLGLDAWAERLAPLAEQWVRTAEGAPDRDFWQSIFIHHEVYGGELMVHGWLVDLFPYVRREAKSTELIPNPALVCDHAARAAAKISVQLSQLPEALSLATVQTLDRKNQPRDVELVGGLVGVRQRGLALEPVAGWLVRMPGDLTQLLHRLAQAPPYTPPHEGGWDPRRADGVPGDLSRAAEVLGGRDLGFARLWPVDRWKIRRAAAGPFGPLRTLIFGDLPDGRLLSTHAVQRAFVYQVCEPAIVPDHTLGPVEKMRQVRALGSTLIEAIAALEGDL